ncbi:uncharacterized protein LOC126739194 isoform X1 [Anthonomus grandis grandis]|uniref:uncharacterized protein LOC126739194 isoform X1 n=1 Tax=Anthonomus grandis grandis TaxID=2921223 RepID=UPI002165BA48|nr:uncharacterized protein LOC126739194 isoform X1 [Anthonomus grandis grandis]XP_050300715.1 uncharacterized protein LOC126739194 isoform X1 [Anthonomus grandis grandis]
MYRLYVERCKSYNKDAAKLSMYSNILNTETNIAFHVPKKHQCGLCATYINGNEERKTELKKNYENHLRKKELSREEETKDAETANENTQVLCFDLQAVLTTPCGEISTFYYKRSLSSYNFTIFDIKDKLGHCFFWYEGIAKRGANEIGSCIYNFFRSDACKSENVIFYSDNCAGQNKNKFLCCLYLFCVTHKNKIKTITHKFLEKDIPIQNEGDSMHATIEKEKKRVLKSGPVYIPAQWVTIIRSAKKTRVPYKVNEISCRDIYDLKALSTAMSNNFVKNSNSEKVISKDIKEEFKTLNIKQNNKKLRSENQEKEIQLQPAFKKPPLIDKKKKQDLLSLCRDSSIKPVYWEFFENLPARTDEVEDKLSESDSD